MRISKFLTRKIIFCTSFWAYFIWLFGRRWQMFIILTFLVLNVSTFKSRLGLYANLVKMHGSHHSWKFLGSTYWWDFWRSARHWGKIWIDERFFSVTGKYRARTFYQIYLNFLYRLFCAKFGIAKKTYIRFWRFASRVHTSWIYISPIFLFLRILIQRSKTSLCCIYPCLSISLVFNTLSARDTTSFSWAVHGSSTMNTRNR